MTFFLYISVLDDDDFNFVITHASQRVELLDPFDIDLSSFTLSFWVKVSSDESTILSYHQQVAGAIGEAYIEIRNASNLIVGVKGYDKNSSSH